MYKMLQWPGDSGSHTRLTFSEDSRHLWTAESGRGAVRAWDIRTGKKEAEIDAGQRVAWTLMVPMREGGAILADQQGGIWRCLVRNGKAERILGDGSEVRAMWCDPNGSRILAARANGTWESLELKDGRVSRVVRQLPADFVRCAEFSKNGRQLAVAGSIHAADAVNEVRIFQVNKEQPVWRGKFQTPVSDLAFGKMDELLVIAESSGVCRCVNIKTSQPIWQVAFGKRVFCCDVSPKCDYLYIGTGVLRKQKSKVPHATFLVFRTSNGKRIYEKKLKGDYVADLQVSPNGKKVAATAGQRLWVWESE